jgi:hypothetical protein
VEEKMLTTSETAERWGCSRQRVLQLLLQGRIPRATKSIRGWQIPDNAKRPDNRKRGPKPA